VLLAAATAPGWIANERIRKMARPLMALSEDNYIGSKKSVCSMEVIEMEVLYVDDDTDILSSYKQYLQKQFHIETALSGEHGLTVLDDMGQFAVVVADVRLPDMDGIQFLARVKERFPDTIRVILTGNADLQTAIDAVNEGSVFRFLTKPCSPETFAELLDSGLRQHQLITSQHKLTRETLVGSIRMLTSVIGMANPVILNRTTRITHYAKMIATQMKLPNLWQIELASTLSQIGCLALPPRILNKLSAGRGLSLREHMMYSSHPRFGADLVANIPRLEPVARIIEQQLMSFKRYMPWESTQNDKISLGAQILRVAIGIDRMLARGLPYGDALIKIRKQPEEYNPEIVDILGIHHIDKIQPTNQDVLDWRSTWMADTDKRQESTMWNDMWDHDMAAELLRSRLQPEMNMEVLFVDSDPDILSSYKRQLRRQFHIEVAPNGEQGLEALDNLGPFAVVVADMRLPDMDSIQFLARVKERSTDTVCIGIARDIDLQTAINIANEGVVFRFLTKPCSPEVIAESVDAGLKQHQLAVTEHEALNKTLIGSIRALNKIIRVLNPAISNYTTHIVRYAKMIATQMKLPNLWQIELASMLSQIGCAFISSRILQNIYLGQPLSNNEREIYSTHPSIGAGLVVNIPRFESVARMIEQQQKRFKDYTSPAETAQESTSDLGAQILKVAIYLNQTLVSGYQFEAAMTKLKARSHDYNPRVVMALAKCQMAKAIFFKGDDSGDEDMPDEAYETEHMDESAIVAELEEIADMLMDQDVGTASLLEDQETSSRLSEDYETEKADEHIENIRPVSLRVTIKADDDIRTEDGTLLVSKDQQISPLMQYIIEQLNGSSGTKGGIPDKREHGAGSSEKINAFVDRDVVTMDGDVLLAKGQETPPLMQHFLERSRDILGLAGYKVVYFDAEGRRRTIGRGAGEESSLDPEFLEIIMKRMREVIETKDYQAEDFDVNVLQVEPADLKTGMVTREDIWTDNGNLLLAKGQEITDVNLRHLYNFSERGALKGASFSVLEKSNTTKGQ